MTRRALDVRERYRAFEERTYGRPWGLQDLTLGLVGDVGDLVKLVQAHEGIRLVEDSRARSSTSSPTSCGRCS